MLRASMLRRSLVSSTSVARAGGSKSMLSKVPRHRDHWLRCAIGDYQLTLLNCSAAVSAAASKHLLSDQESVRQMGLVSAFSLLLSAGLKGEERVIVRMLGDQKDVYAESVHAGELRAYAREAPERDSLLSVTRVLYGQTKPFTSTVPLSAKRDDSDIQQFLDRSESTPSSVRVFSVGEFVGGVLLQSLPSRKEAPLVSLTDKLPNLERSFVDDEMSLKQVLDKMADVIGGEPGEISYCPVTFYCRCSKKQFESAVSAETLEMLKQNKESFICHYCNTEYAA